MNKQIEVFKMSGRSPLLGVALTLGFGIMFGIILSFLYTFLVVTIQFPYFNLFILLGYGMALGYITLYATRLGKIRNKKQAIFLALVVGIFAYYFQWVSFLNFFFTGNHDFEGYQESLGSLPSAGLLLFILNEVNSMGTWLVFDVVLNGPALWFFWIFEMVFILGLPPLMVYRYPIIPFSEELNSWYRKYTLKYQFESIATQQAFRKEFKINVPETINKLNYGAPTRYSEVVVYFLERENVQFVSVENVFIEDRGKGKTNRSSVIHLQPINTTEAKQLMEEYRSKKEWLLNY